MHKPTNYKLSLIYRQSEANYEPEVSCNRQVEFLIMYPFAKLGLRNRISQCKRKSYVCMCRTFKIPSSNL